MDRNLLILKMEENGFKVTEYKAHITGTKRIKYYEKEATVLLRTRSANSFFTNYMREPASVYIYLGGQKKTELIMNNISEILNFLMLNMQWLDFITTTLNFKVKNNKLILIFNTINGETKSVFGNI